MAKKIPKTETDSEFVLKIVLFFILGGMWVRLTGLDFSDGSISLPVGLFIGLFFAAHDHFQIDRKIEYVVLLISAIMSYVLPTGFVLIL